MYQFAFAHCLNFISSCSSIKLISSSATLRVPKFSLFKTNCSLCKDCIFLSISLGSYLLLFEFHWLRATRHQSSLGAKLWRSLVSSETGSHDVLTTCSPSSLLIQEASNWNKGLGLLSLCLCLLKLKKRGRWSDLPAVNTSALVCLICSNHAWFVSTLSSLSLVKLLPSCRLHHVNFLPIYPRSCKSLRIRAYLKSFIYWTGCNLPPSFSFW